MADNNDILTDYQKKWAAMSEDDKVAELEVFVLKKWRDDQCKRGIHLADIGTTKCNACGCQVDPNIPVSVKDGQPLYRPHQNNAVN